MNLKSCYCRALVEIAFSVHFGKLIFSQTVSNLENRKKLQLHIKIKVHSWNNYRNVKQYIKSAYH